MMGCPCLYCLSLGELLDMVNYTASRSTTITEESLPCSTKGSGTLLCLCIRLLCQSLSSHEATYVGVLLLILSFFG
jgi:hypothetical protein